MRAKSWFIALITLQQIHHMKKFIEQEAQEKAEEIMIKVEKLAEN